ncbi:MAG: enoyl-CoA hydratase/isomerase family protein [Burkholderiales bacterium]|nr:enoyl-CoA hydratase/isomerase family protein [Burkholderiales bacterium]
MSRRFDGCVAEPIAAHAGAPLLQRADGLLRITLNRPAEHNRLDPADVDALLPLLDTLAQQGDTRALVITGSGEATFSSGYTLQAIVDELDDRFERMLDTIEQLPFPTIAACNGSVYGGATDLALCCDFRIGMPGMKMFMPAARFGLHYYPGGLRRYLTRLGLPAASKLMLTAMTIEADEMLRIGFLTELVAREAFDGLVDSYLEHIVRTDATVVAGMKRHLLEMAHAALESAAGRATLTSMGDAYQDSLQSDELRTRLAQLGKHKR